MGGLVSAPSGSDRRSDRGDPEIAIDRAIDEVLRPWKELLEPVVVLFSGGLDSGLLAWELRGFTRLRLVTVGAPHSPDLGTAHEAARMLRLRWTGREVSPTEVERLARELERELVDLSAVDRSVQVAMAVALAEGPAGPLLCGQGTDELFGGYAHYRGLSPEEAARRSAADLEKLLNHDWPRTIQVAARLGRSVTAPYLDPRFVSAALALPPEVRLASDPPKAWFRSFARRRGLPEALVTRPKRAFQYSSGVDRILRRSG